MFCSPSWNLNIASRKCSEFINHKAQPNDSEACFTVATWNSEHLRKGEACYFVRAWNWAHFCGFMHEKNGGFLVKENHKEKFTNLLIRVPCMARHNCEHSCGEFGGKLSFKKYVLRLDLNSHSAKILFNYTLVVAGFQEVQLNLAGHVGIFSPKQRKVFSMISKPVSFLFTSIYWFKSGSL